MSSPQYQLVVFGATGFVGKIVCRYLIEHYGTELAWAAAGRSLDKLTALKASLGAAANGLALIVADADDEASLKNLCATTQVVLSTVGPYALHGEALIRACAETGTDYCDLTGEVQWMRKMLDRYEETAKTTGARIVSGCGFDSIPSDLGVYFLQQQAMQRWNQPCTHIKMRVETLRGGFSGGTVATLINTLREAESDSGVRAQLADPYLLCPRDFSARTAQTKPLGARLDRDFAAWCAPFIMSGVNVPVVLRSYALLEQAWGQDFRYDEALLTGRGFKGCGAAVGVTTLLVGLIVALSFKPTRWLLTRFYLPAPGTGPSLEQQRDGCWDLRFLGLTQTGKAVRVRVRGGGDPGYASTARMLGEAGVCLAQNIPAEHPGGFWTPATLFGAALIERLGKHADIGFEMLDLDDQ